jgi:hypothetical protein
MARPIHRAACGSRLSAFNVRGALPAPEAVEAGDLMRSAVDVVSRYFATRDVFDLGVACADLDATGRSRSLPEVIERPVARSLALRNKLSFHISPSRVTS